MSRKYCPGTPEIPTFSQMCCCCPLTAAPTSQYRNPNTVDLHPKFPSARALAASSESSAARSCLTSTAVVAGARMRQPQCCL